MIKIHTKRFGYICFKLRTLCLFFSPNAHEWSATFMLGGGKAQKQNRLLAKLRRRYLGHNFEIEGVNKVILERINKNGF